MKQLKRVLFCVATIATIVSCGKSIKGEGDILTRNYNVSESASKISIAQEINLILSDAIEEGVIQVTTYENIFGYIDVKGGSSVDIEMESKNNYKDYFVTVEASSKQFNAFRASGATNIEVKGADLTFDSYSFDLSGASDVRIRNNITTKSCNINSSGACTVYGDNITAQTLNADLSGACSVTMTVTDKINGDLSGSTSIRYYGGAAVSVDTSGASSVKQISK